MRRIRELRPSPAMAVAFVALFVAGAGGATAAKSLITGKQVKNNSITGKDVKNGSLLKNDFKRGQLPAGPQGPQGVVGPAGRAGRDGLGALSYHSAAYVIPEGDPGGDAGIALCPAGKYPTGGDAWALDEAEELVPSDEVLMGDFFWAENSAIPDSWLAVVKANPLPEDLILTVEVICSNSSQVPATAFNKRELSARKALKRAY